MSGRRQMRWAEVRALVQRARRGTLLPQKLLPAGRFVEQHGFIEIR